LTDAKDLEIIVPLGNTSRVEKLPQALQSLYLEIWNDRCKMFDRYADEKISPRDREIYQEHTYFFYKYMTAIHLIAAQLDPDVPRTQNHIYYDWLIEQAKEHGFNLPKWLIKKTSD
jgi:hypothetical protein